MSAFDQALRSELADIASHGLARHLDRIDSPPGVTVTTDGTSLLNFSSNDYLGLAQHPTLCEAAAEAAQQWGAGSGGSRLISGSLGIHHTLDEALARFKQTEAALSFGSGYVTALGTIGALLDRDDVVILDKRVHACCVDAARLSPATLRVFRHNDLNDLEDILKWCRNRTTTPGPRPARILVVTESIFSMDGDHAPLKELVTLKDHYGAWLMLDEAHATGILGGRGGGLAQELGVSQRIEIQMGTLGKALGSVGGFVAGSQPLVELLINRARTFLFSTAPTPAGAGAALCALNLVQTEEGNSRRMRLWQRVEELNDLIPQTTRNSAAHAPAPIVPWILGDERLAIQAAERLRHAGIFARAIRFPTVGRGQARIRFTVTANHTQAHLRTLASALASSEIASAPTP